jgi:GH25 family lysozyme M1 (1,4-beta-N-acetylmuramidase)
VVLSRNKKHKNKNKMIALALLSSLSVAMATGGVDVSQRTYVDNWSCMVKNGKSFAIVRVYQSNGKPDANGKILFVLASSSLTIF